MGLKSDGTRSVGLRLCHSCNAIDKHHAPEVYDTFEYLKTLKDFIRQDIEDHFGISTDAASSRLHLLKRVGLVVKTGKTFPVPRKDQGDFPAPIYEVVR